MWKLQALSQNLSRQNKIRYDSIGQNIMLGWFSAKISF